jgi:hypothetical protein
VLLLCVAFSFILFLSSPLPAQCVVVVFAFFSNNIRNVINFYEIAQAARERKRSHSAVVRLLIVAVLLRTIGNNENEKKF